MSKAPQGSTRGANGRFLPGHSGRPPGARNKRPHRIADAILAHFEKRQEDLLDDLLEKGYRSTYMELVTRFLPKDAEELEAYEEGDNP
jgi:hypothetical protein